MSQQKKAKMEGLIFRASASDFIKIPGSPVAYWSTPRIYQAFSDFEPLEKFASPRKGLATCNDELWLRYWHEVDIMHTSLFDGDVKKYKWFPLSKGGAARKWYGNNELVINWENNGEDLKNFIKKRYNGGSFTKEIRSEEYYFKDCLTWSDISGETGFCVRRSAKGSIISTKGCGIYAEPENLTFLAGFLNSKPAKLFLTLTSPTVSTNPGELAALPVLDPTQHNLSDINCIPEQCINIAHRDWDSHEESWNFRKPILFYRKHFRTCLSESFQELSLESESITLEMLNLEQKNNEIFINAYTLQDELTPEVSLEEITLSCNPYYRYGGNRSDVELAMLFQCDTLKELVSYAIGCMMGRYSLDKPGLVLASQGETLQDYISQIPAPRFMPDNDAILPLTDQEWFADDATNRFREFVRVVWGEETLQENLAFVADSLCLHAIKPKRGESAIDTIRRYLSTQFYKDHLRTYKKRPIYWLFSSGKHKAFECLVYLHRYNEGTLARMRTEYVIPLTAKLNSYAAKLENDKEASHSAAETKRIEKELDTLHKQQAELATFDEKLRHHADQRISLDLDDGVKVNYGKFGDLLAEVKAVTGDKGE